MVSVMGFSLPVPVDTELIASIRYSGMVHLRVEEIAPDTLAAQRTAESVGNILSVMRGLASADGPKDERDAAMRSVLSSAKVSQKEDRAVLTASATLEAARLLSGESAVSAQNRQGTAATPKAVPVTSDRP